MKAQTRFGPAWTWFALLVIFGPIPPVTLYALSLPESSQSPALIALAFSGVPLFIAAIAIQVPWRRRHISFESRTVRVIRSKDGRPGFVLDAARPYAGFLAIREGRNGRYGAELIRWIQAKLEQDGAVLRLEFPVDQSIRPVREPFESLPGPEACERLEALLGLDFAIDETALDRAARRPPAARRGEARFLECEDGLDELLAFLRTNPRTNTWRRGGADTIDI